MMVKRAQEPADAFSRQVINAIEDEIGRSGRSVAEVLEHADMSRNYYYKRVRGEMPFNTNDVSKIADVLGIDALQLLKRSAAAATGRPAFHVVSGGLQNGEPPTDKPDLFTEPLDYSEMAAKKKQADIDETRGE